MPAVAKQEPGFLVVWLIIQAPDGGRGRGPIDAVTHDSRRRVADKTCDRRRVLEPSPLDQLNDHDDDHDYEQDVHRVPRQYRNRDGPERPEQPQYHEDRTMVQSMNPPSLVLTGVLIVAAGGEGFKKDEAIPRRPYPRFRPHRPGSSGKQYPTVPDTLPGHPTACVLQ
jgi:hypothetical protein